MKYYGIAGVVLLIFALSGCQKEPLSQQNTSAKSNGIHYTLSDDGVLEIQGSGKLTCEKFSFYSDNGTDWDVIETIKKIIIHEGITQIGEDCFSDFDSVESVILPKGLKKIDENAFRGSVMVKRINIPKTVEEIGNYVKKGCMERGIVRIQKWKKSITGRKPGYNRKAIRLPMS